MFGKDWLFVNWFVSWASIPRCNIKPAMNTLHISSGQSPFAQNKAFTERQQGRAKIRFTISVPATLALAWEYYWSASDDCEIELNYTNVMQRISRSRVFRSI
jgi:hypothetical protein